MDVGSGFRVISVISYVKIPTPPFRTEGKALSNPYEALQSLIHASDG